MTIFNWKLFILLSLIASSSSISNRKLIIVLLDGFGLNFISWGVTPNLGFWAAIGVHAINMGNQFPTKTRVQLFSIATGLTPQTSGVTGNEVWDRDLGQYLSYGYSLYHVNKFIVPIWTLNELQGGKSAVMMWGAGEFEFKGRHVSYHKALNKDIPREKRVDGVIDWLKKGVNLAMLYIDQPDKHGHGYGPNSAKEKDMVKRVDATLGYLDQALAAARLDGKTDVIVLSDHGMKEVRPKNFIKLQQWMDLKNCKLYGKSPVVTVVCKKGLNNKHCQMLDGKGKATKAFRAYQNEHLPKRWHYRSSRTGPCTVVANPGYAFWDMWESANGASKKTHIRVTKETTYGTHGYDNNVPEMKPIFFARGPSFRKNVKVTKKFSNIDLYWLFCKILGLKPTTRIDGNNRMDIWNQMLVY